MKSPRTFSELACTCASSDIAGRFRETTTAFQGGPLAYYMPYTSSTQAQVSEFAALKPRLCAPMLGSTFVGNGEQALLDMATVIKELLG